MRRVRAAHGGEHADRALLWKGRKSAFAAMGRIATDYYVQDGVVPRTRLPELLRKIEELSTSHGLRVGNVFHAGDGNLHPLGEKFHDSLKLEVLSSWHEVVTRYGGNQHA